MYVVIVVTLCIITVICISFYSVYFLSRSTFLYLPFGGKGVRITLSILRLIVEKPFTSLTSGHDLFSGVSVLSLSPDGRDSRDPKDDTKY